MKDYCKKAKKQIEDTADADLFDELSEGRLELFHSALIEEVYAQLQKFDKEAADIELLSPSKQHKIRMNRLFREHVGDTFLPFPEVDNFYEKVRSMLVIKLKINEFSHHRQKRKLSR